MESPTRTQSWFRWAARAWATTAEGLPPLVLCHCQIHIPVLASGARSACQGAGRLTAGRLESGTSTAGCQGGGDGTGACGGGGHPASVTPPEAAGADARATLVVVVVVTVGAGGGGVLGRSAGAAVVAVEPHVV